VRKARWSRQGRGKSGGVRVIYYHWTPDDEVYLLHIYAKSEQADMSAADHKAVKAFVEVLKRAKEEKEPGYSRIQDGKADTSWERRD